MQEKIILSKLAIIWKLTMIQIKVVISNNKPLTRLILIGFLLKIRKLKVMLAITNAIKSFMNSFIKQLVKIFSIF